MLKAVEAFWALMFAESNAFAFWLAIANVALWSLNGQLFTIVTAIVCFAWAFREDLYVSANLDR